MPATMASRGRPSSARLMSRHNAPNHHISAAMPSAPRSSCALMAPAWSLKYAAILAVEASLAGAAPGRSVPTTLSTTNAMPAAAAARAPVSRRRFPA